MNAFQQTRKFVIAQYNLTEDEATSFITQGVNFGMTQLVDGNWGVHGIVSKANFEQMLESGTSGTPQHYASFTLICTGMLLSSFALM